MDTSPKKKKKVKTQQSVLTSFLGDSTHAKVWEAH